MPAVLICTKPDGRITITAMAEPPAGYEQDAIEVPSIEEATSMAAEVLGGETAGEEAAEEAVEDKAPEGSEGMPMETEDDQMAAGFNRARKGY